MVRLEVDTVRHWQACLADMVFACSVAPVSQTSVLLRATHALLLAAPQAIGLDFGDIPPVELLEPQLRAKAEVASVLALIEGRGSYMLSHGPGGTHLATVVFAGTCEEASATGASAALALLGALAASLAGPALDLGREPTADFAGSALRLN